MGVVFELDFSFELNSALNWSPYLKLNNKLSNKTFKSI
jgi:hypothetical protein